MLNVYVNTCCMDAYLGSVQLCYMETGGREGYERCYLYNRRERGVWVQLPVQQVGMSVLTEELPLQLDYPMHILCSIKVFLWNDMMRKINKLFYTVFITHWYRITYYAQMHVYGLTITHSQCVIVASPSKWNRLVLWRFHTTRQIFACNTHE